MGVSQWNLRKQGQQTQPGLLQTAQRELAELCFVYYRRDVKVTLLSHTSHGSFWTAWAMVAADGEVLRLHFCCVHTAATLTCPQVRKPFVFSQAITSSLPALPFNSERSCSNNFIFLPANYNFPLFVIWIYTFSEMNSFVLQQINKDVQ